MGNSRIEPPRLWTTIRPSLRFTRSIASGTISEAGAEEVSTTASTPLPPLISWMRSRTSSVSACSVKSAPSLRPTSRRRPSRARPVRMMRSAPAALAAMTAASPCWPGPMTTSVRPGPVCASTTAHCTPLPIGNAIAACSPGTWSGMRCSTVAGGMYRYWL